MTVFQLAALGLATAAAVSDLKTRRIPNVLTFGSAVIALAAHTYVDGGSGLGWSIAGWLVGLIFFLPMFTLGGMGAGDVKLLAALGAWLGPGPVVWVALF